MKNIQTKRYTINNRRSDCLIKEKLIAEAAEEAAADQTSSQRQHKRFNIDQYLRHFYNLFDYRKELERFAQIHRLVISISAIESQTLNNFYDQVSHTCKEIEQAQKICNNCFATIDEVTRIPQSAINNLLKRQQENNQRICDEVNRIPYGVKLIKEQQDRFQRICDEVILRRL